MVLEIDFILFEIALISKPLHRFRGDPKVIMKILRLAIPGLGPEGPPWYGGVKPTRCPTPKGAGP
jgi:hypothetical protein